MLHKKSNNDSVPPKFEKRPCSTKIWQTTMLHQKIWKATMLHQKFEKWPCSIKKLIWPSSPKMWQMASNSGGTWSFLKLAWSLLKFFDGVWSLLKFLWSMVVSQILVEPGHINFPPEFEKWQCPTRIWEMTMFHQILRPFWWNTVIFIFRWSMVAFQIFRWSMVASQIFVDWGQVFHQNLKNDNVPPKV